MVLICLSRVCVREGGRGGGNFYFHICVHCEHALPPTAPLSGLGRIYLPGQPCSPRLQGSLAHPAHSLMRIVNNASSLRACITPTAPLSGASTFQGSLARRACRAALLTLLTLFQGSLARPACRAALLRSPVRSASRAAPPLGIDRE
jgi:hypothetical protein